jgi:hypothetical protein
VPTALIPSLPLPPPPLPRQVNQTFVQTANFTLQQVCMCVYVCVGGGGMRTTERGCVPFKNCLGSYRRKCVGEDAYHRAGVRPRKKTVWTPMSCWEYHYGMGCPNQERDEIQKVQNEL